MSSLVDKVEVEKGNKEQHKAAMDKPYKAKDHMVVATKVPTFSSCTA